MDVALGVKLDPTGVKRGAREVKTELSSLARHAGQAQKRMAKSFEVLRNSIFSVRSALLTLAGGLSFAGAIRAGKEFGESIGELSAITGATGDTLDYLRDKAKEYGRTTTLTASQSAEAFKLIASAKPDLLANAEALSIVTHEAITLAEATGQDLPTAASTLGSALNQFGAGADQASKFINTLAAGAKFGAASVAETAEALKFAGTVSATLGTKFETTVAAIQQLSKVALKGGEAGTGLRNVMLRLEQASDRNLRPSVVGLVAALENLNKKGETTPELIERFGFRSIVAAKNLLSSVDSLKELETAVTGTSVALEQQSAKLDNLAGDAKGLASAYEGLQIAIEERADAALRRFTQSMTKFLRVLTDNIEEVVRLGKAFATLVVGFASAKLLGPVLSSIGANAALFVASLRNMNAGLVAAEASAIALRAPLIALRGIMAALGGPAGLILLGVSALYAWFSASNDAKQSTEEFEGSLSKLRKEMQGFTREKLDAAVLDQRDALRDLRDELADVQSDIAAKSRAGRRRGASAGRQKAQEDIVRLRAQEQDIADRVAQTEQVILDLQKQRASLDFVGPPVPTDEQQAKQALEQAKALQQVFTDTAQQGKELLTGVFPEEEEIAKLKNLITQIEEFKKLIATKDDAFREQLAEEGITVDKLNRAIDAHKKKIKELNEEKTKATGTELAYTNALDQLNRAISTNNVKTTEGKLAYETAAGSLKDLTDAQKEQLLTLARVRDLQEKAQADADKESALATRYKSEGKALSESLDPTVRYANAVEHLTKLKEAGAISSEEFQEAVKNEALKTNEAAALIRDEFGKAFTGIIDGTKSVQEAMFDMTNSILQSMNRLIGQKLGEALFDSLFSPGPASKSGGGGILDLFSGAAKSGGGGEGGGGGAAGLFTTALTGLSTFLGFANGGEFTIGGQGGTDSQVVAFKGTPGEQVSVKTPAQQKDEQPAQQPIVVPPAQVQVVNVTNPNEIPQAMDSAAGKQVFMNFIERNRSSIRQMLQ